MTALSQSVQRDRLAIGVHHGLVHEGGYGLRCTDDGLFTFTRPDGARVEPNGVRCFRGQAIEAMQFLERRPILHSPKL